MLLRSPDLLRQIAGDSIAAMAWGAVELEPEVTNWLDTLTDERAGRAIRLASEIRALREKKGLSQRQLAELVGTTQSAIARLEGGRISPSLPTLDRIANALGAEVTVTFTDTEELLGTR